MQQNNPYSAPNAPVSDMQNDEGFGDLKIFTSNGRLGRLRYILYLLGISLVGGILAILLFMIPFVGPFLGGAVYIGLIVVSVLLTIQRCHDFDKTGWLTLLLLVPLVSLIFYFIPGTKGSNQYGLLPPPNSTAIKIGAFILIAFFAIGIVAAILGMPAYQQYLMKAGG